MLVVDNKVVILKGTLADFDAADEVADLFDASTNANGTLEGALEVGDKAVIIVAADSGTAVSIAYVNNAALAAVADSEVTMVGSFTGATADTVDLLAAANFKLD